MLFAARRSERWASGPRCGSGPVGRALIEATDTDGLDQAVRDQTISILREHPDITAVYSIGGGNRAILDAFDIVDRHAGSSSPTTSTATTCR